MDVHAVARDVEERDGRGKLVNAAPARPGGDIPAQTLRKPDVVAQLRDAGLTTLLMSLAEAKAFMADEATRWGEAGRRSNATVD